MTESTYDVYGATNSTRGMFIKAWTRGVPVEEAALDQLVTLAQMPFLFKHIAAMPDVHFGMGSTVGSVIATRGAVIPAAVGVDIGCGMVAARTGLSASDLPDSLLPMRTAIEAAVPHGRTNDGKSFADQGSWRGEPSALAMSRMSAFVADTGIEIQRIQDATGARLHANLENAVNQCGTLGTGNHFIEVCLDEADKVWVMLHSGSRGIGNAIGRHFIDLAKKDMKTWFINVPDQDLAYLPEGTDHYEDYMIAVEWAQRFAALNRKVMLEATLTAISAALGRPISADVEAINCHHNYVTTEHHFGHNVQVTRKGAVRARLGDLGIIPGSMGARSYIVRGKGNPESFCSCSHGAGRAMSRTEARKRFTLDDHAKATAGVECRKDDGVLDETPAAYKDIDAVMAAQTDLVEIVHTLRQVVCVKG